MKLSEVLSDKNRDLYRRITREKKVNLESADGDCWGSQIDDQSAIITYVEDANPEACFVHELLHIKLQLNGFRRLKWGISSCDILGYMSVFMIAFDNEMQHHKIYEKYCNLGYDPDHFYNDDDALNTKRHIDEYLKDSDKNFLMIMTQYMTLTSAGSDRIFDDMNQYRKSFRSIPGGSNRNILDTIDDMLIDWKNEESLDYEGHLTRLFEKIPGSQYSFFSYGTMSEFPKNGFFTSLPFRINKKGDSIEIISI